jgi:hypothetical protein
LFLLSYSLLKIAPVTCASAAKEGEEKRLSPLLFGCLSTRARKRDNRLLLFYSDDRTSTANVRTTRKNERNDVLDDARCLTRERERERVGVYKICWCRIGTRESEL